MCGHECDCDCHNGQIVRILVPWMHCFRCDCRECPICLNMISKILLDIHIAICHTVVKSMPIQKRTPSEFGSMHHHSAA